jgi:hypothetical protein
MNPGIEPHGYGQEKVLLDAASKERRFFEPGSQNRLKQTPPELVRCRAPARVEGDRRPTT